MRSGNPVGIERLCLFGMPPDAHVRLAEALGCDTVGMGLDAMQAYNPQRYAGWSLRSDAALRRRTIDCCGASGVTIGLCEGFFVAREGDISLQAADLDLAAELGAERINVVSVTRDLARTHDGFAQIAELAAARGMRTVTEIGVGPITTLTAAIAAIAKVGRPDFGLMIDTMHFFRFGSTVADLATIDPALIGYVQLCDVPLIPEIADYMDEALHERLVPGEGELPLLEFARLIPDGVPVSVEVPRRSLAERGIGPLARVAPCVEAARSLLPKAFV